MWLKLMLGCVLVVCAWQAKADAPALSAVDSSLLDAGCWYMREDGDEVFLMWFAAPVDAGAPKAVLGLGGKSVPLQLEGEGTEASVFRGEHLQVRVLAGEDIPQDCGDECAGSLRRVRVEVSADNQAPRTFDAVERCGC